MSHLDPEQLALLALDEPVASDGDREHLATCPECADELAAMRHAAIIARSTADEASLEAPPERVWERIADELRLGAAPADSPATPPKRRRRALVAWILAASLVVVAAVGIGVWTSTSNSRPTQIATAALDAFPQHPGASGTADVDETGSGQRQLRVSLPDTTTEGYREVWLLSTDATALISLGLLDGSSGTFAIPAGIDLDRYRLVDISAEPLDGDPAHSGDSIARGELRFV